MAKDYQEQYQKGRVVISDLDGTLIKPLKSEESDLFEFNNRWIDELLDASRRGAKVFIVTSGTNSIRMHKFLINLLDSKTGEESEENQKLKRHFGSDEVAMNEYKATAKKLLEIFDVCGHYENIRKGFGTEEMQGYFKQEGSTRRNDWDEKDNLFLSAAPKIRKGSLKEFDTGHDLLKIIEKSEFEIVFAGNDQNDQFMTWQFAKEFPGKKFRLLNASMTGEFEGRVDEIFGVQMPQPEPLENLKNILRKEQPKTGLKTENTEVSVLKPEEQVQKK